MFSHLESIIMSFAHTLPLEVFVLVASFVEEVIAPIPSPAVMVLAGSLAKIQEYGVYALILLSIIGAIGKTMGALVVYIITDKAEDMVMNKFGAFFNVTRDDVVRLGNKLGNGPRDYIFMTLVRAFPFVPSVVVSVGSGLLKVRLPLFIISTFIGTIVRDGFYLYAGYVGVQLFALLITHSAKIEDGIVLITTLIVIGFMGYRMYLRKVTKD